MMKFRKKPIIVEATRWFKNGDHPEDGPSDQEGKVIRYYRDPDVDGYRECSKCGRRLDVHGWIDTLEGEHIVCPGDWIITGIQGKYYPCKPDIFEASYEPIQE